MYFVFVADVVVDGVIRATVLINVEFVFVDFGVIVDSVGLAVVFCHIGRFLFSFYVLFM